MCNSGVASYLEDIPQKSSLYDGMLDKIMTPSDVSFLGFSSVSM